MVGSAGTVEIGFDPRVEPFNLFAPGVMDDPYPYYRRLRDLDPVHHNEEVGYYFVSRHRDVVDLTRAGALIRGRSLSGVFEAYRGTALFDVLLESNLFGLDEPRHGELKAQVVGTLTARRVRALRPRVEQICAELMDELAPDPRGGRFELISAIGQRLPFEVICELVGIPTDDRAEFLRWSKKVLPIADPFPSDEVVRAALDGGGAFDGYLTAVISERRRALRAGRPVQPGLLTDLVTESLADPGLFQRHELICLCFTMLVAGYENVTNLIGNTMRALTENPEQAVALRENPALMDNLADEVLRYYATTQYNSREVTADVTVGDVTIPRGATLALLRGSANRDERAFPDPDTFDLRRPNSHDQVGFGEGATYCTGAALARLELTVVYKEILARMGELRIADWRMRPTKLFWGPDLVEVEYGPVRP